MRFTGKVGHEGEVVVSLLRGYYNPKVGGNDPVL